MQPTDNSALRQNSFFSPFLLFYTCPKSSGVNSTNRRFKNKNWPKMSFNILIEWGTKYPKSPIVQQSCEMSDMDYTSSTLWTWYSNLLGHGHGNNFVIKRVLTKNTTLPWDQINVHEHGALMRYVYQHNT